MKEHIITENEYSGDSLLDTTRSEKCVFCGSNVVIKLTNKTYRKIMDRKHKSIQNLGIMLPDCDREFFISGICKHCQKDIFGY